MNPISIVTGNKGGSGQIVWPAIDLPSDIDRIGNIASNKLVISSLNTTSGLFEDLITILSGAVPSVSISGLSSLTLPEITAGTVYGIYAGTSSLIHTFFPVGSQGFNIFVGEDAGNFTMDIAGGASTRSSFLTAVGHEALNDVTIGTGSTAVGFHSLTHMTSGGYNDAFGDVSLFSLLTGTYNSAFGQGSQYSNVSGIGNVSVGVGSLYTNILGSGNISIGQQSLYNVLTDGNICIGYKAGFHETSGANNFYIDNYLATRANLAADRANALMYGVFGANAAAQTLNINAGQFVVSGVGPHSIGGAVIATAQLCIQGTFAPASSSPYGFYFIPTLTPNATAGAPIGFAIVPTLTLVNGWTVTSYWANYIGSGTVLASGAATITTAAQLYIPGIVTPAAGVTITNNYALYVGSGTSFINGYTLFGANIYVIGTCASAGFLVGATAGIDTTITTAGLVGKTITITKGIITGFA